MGPGTTNFFDRFSAPVSRDTQMRPLSTFSTKFGNCVAKLCAAFASASASAPASASTSSFAFASGCNACRRDLYLMKEPSLCTFFPRSSHAHTLYMHVAEGMRR